MGHHWIASVSAVAYIRTDHWNGDHQSEGALWKVSAIDGVLVYLDMWELRGILGIHWQMHVVSAALS